MTTIKPVRGVMSHCCQAQVWRAQTPVVAVPSICGNCFQICWAECDLSCECHDTTHSLICGTCCTPEEPGDAEVAVRRWAKQIETAESGGPGAPV